MIIPVRDSMRASGNAKPFDIGTYGRNKVIAQPLLLRFVKGISFVQVPLRGLQDSNPHQRCLPRESLISSHSSTRSRPSATAFRRASKSCFCQSGIRTASAFARRSSQRASIIWSFSCSGSCLISAILTVQNSTHLAAAAQLRPLAGSGVRYAANDPDFSHGLS